MKCEICHRGMAEGVNLYRVNEKGVLGIWRCDDHHCAESLKQAADIQWLTDILDGKKETRQ